MAISMAGVQKVLFGKEAVCARQEVSHVLCRAVTCRTGALGLPRKDTKTCGLNVICISKQWGWGEDPATKLVECKLSKIHYFLV